MYTANTVNKAEEIYSILKERNPGKKINVAYDYNKKIYEIVLTNEKYTNDPEIPVDLSMKVVYGDSVVADTPILTRNNETGIVDIVTIQTLFDNNQGELLSVVSGKYETVPENLQVYTSSGWNNVEKLIKHKSDKKLYTVSNHRGHVTVTEDHSLLSSRKVEIKPIDCTMYTSLLYAYPNEFKDLVTVPNECAYALGVVAKIKPYTRNKCIKLNTKDAQRFVNGIKQILPDKISLDTDVNHFEDVVEIRYNSKYFNDFKMKKLENSVQYVILNATTSSIISYLSGYLQDDVDDITNFNLKFSNSLECAGFYYILKRLSYNVEILSETELYAYDNDINRNTLNPLSVLQEPSKTEGKEVFVYDIQTELGSFQAGIGETIVKNTDSIFIEMKYNRDNHVLNRHDTFKIASVCGAKLTNDVFNRKPIEMEFEKVFQPFILLTKKRYIGKKFEDLKDPLKMKEITAAGIALTRRDYSQFVKNCYKGVIDEIVNNADVESGILVYKDYIQKLEDNTVDIDTLVLSAQLAKEYKTSPVHVVLAKKLKDRQEEVQVGDRIPYIYIETNDPKLKKSELGEDPMYAKLNGLKINKWCYLEQLAKPLLGFFKVVMRNSPEKMDALINYTNEKMVMFGGKKLKNSEFILPGLSE